MGLKTYSKKRDFTRTSEPQPKIKHSRTGRLYVIQKHDASRLHYDFRLELDGVLKSWAIPKGPSLDPSERRLAMEVEDHPLDYGKFEGVIPEGEYGGGTVMIWDTGRWEPEEDAAEGYKNGKLTFRLEGERLHGRWHLVRMADRRGTASKPAWLIFKDKDEAARPTARGDVLAEATSARSGRTMEQIASDRDRVWSSSGEIKSNGKTKKSTARAADFSRKKTERKAEVNSAAVLERLKKAGARPGATPHKPDVELALLARSVPTGAQWIHEIKYDGYRMIAQVEKGRARLYTRHGLDWTAKFPTLAAQLSALPVRQAFLDGEVVMLDPNGRSSFQALQNALKAKHESELRYFIFDLLYLDGYDTRPAPLSARKAALADLLAIPTAASSGAIRYSDHFAGDGKEFFQQACRHALEGVVSKCLDRPYHAGRGGDWVKIKCDQRQEFVIGGWTDPAGTRSAFGALLIGYYEGKELVYAGRVGTGFDERTLKDLQRRLKPLVQSKPSFRNPPAGGRNRGVHWVKPELVAEVAYGNWTQDGILRHPVYKGLREDKAAGEVVRELARDVPPPKEDTMKTKETPRATHPAPRAKTSKPESVEIAGVRLTHPDRVLYPEQGITKKNLAEYYERIAQWILPHIKGRPLTLVRCPQGRAHQCFYQKHIKEDLPQGLHGVPIREQEAKEEEIYLVLDDLSGLIALVQLGVLELHLWGSREKRLEQPDRLIFDLDPGPGVTWEALREGAQAVRARLRELNLESFVKTTGGKGLHVVVPLTPAADWDRCKQFAREVAEACARRTPDAFTVNMSKARRTGKIYLDFLRNGRGATSVAPYSTRARPGATVSTPLTWPELARLRDPASFTVETVPARLKRLKKDPWAGIFEIKQKIK